ncbi:hypothetical protein AABB24_007884, partial [Solanum stoloniferum]
MAEIPIERAQFEIQILKNLTPLRDNKLFSEISTTFRKRNGGWTAGSIHIVLGARRCLIPQPQGQNSSWKHGKVVQKMYQHAEGDVGGYISIYRRVLSVNSPPPKGCEACMALVVSFTHLPFASRILLYFGRH